jgi:hypothetical protein
MSSTGGCFVLQVWRLRNQQAQFGAALRAQWTMRSGVAANSLPGGVDPQHGGGK